MTENDASDILEITFPIDPQTLKKQYRKLSLERHPDRATGSEKAFKNLGEAYEFVKKNSDHLIRIIGEQWQEIHTIDGTPLCELGLGLGPTTNGRPCDSCHGEGHLPILVRGEYQTCESCRGRFGNRCILCNGTGTWFKHIKTNERMFCIMCKGTGEIKLYNPVLPKGALKG